MRPLREQEYTPTGHLLMQCNEPGQDTSREAGQGRAYPHQQETPLDLTKVWLGQDKIFVGPNKLRGIGVEKDTRRWNWWVWHGWDVEHEHVFDP